MIGACIDPEIIRRSPLLFVPRCLIITRRLVTRRGSCSLTAREKSPGAVVEVRARGWPSSRMESERRAKRERSTSEQSGNGERMTSHRPAILERATRDRWKSDKYTPPPELLVRTCQWCSQGTCWTHTRTLAWKPTLDRTDRDWYTDQGKVKGKCQIVSDEPEGKSKGKGQGKGAKKECQIDNWHEC